jgi:hypothetical protein
MTLLLMLLALAFLVALLAVPILLLTGRFYAYRDTISAQVQACGLSLQIGAFLMGWAPASWFAGRSARYAPTRLILFAPHDTGSRFLFQLLILGHGVSFATRKPVGFGSYSWPGDGIRLV